MSMFKFTFNNLANDLLKVKDIGYVFKPLSDYWLEGGVVDPKVCFIRVDVDFSIQKAALLADLLSDLGIKGSFFIRLHAPEYNPFDFANIDRIKRIVSQGHEIGLHSEIVDLQEICGGSAESWLRSDLKLMELLTGCSCTSAASHGGLTGYNNLDFWEKNDPKSFGLNYEAYEETENFSLFANCRYVSDSEIAQWKAYHDGILLPNDRRSPSQHAQEEHRALYVLLHGDVYDHKNKYF